MRWIAHFLLLVLGVLFVSCDSAGPEATPDPHFTLSTGAPVNASVEGEATLGNDLTFGEQSLFVHPLQGLDKTLTIVQLSGEYESAVTHDLSFVRLADGPLSTGTYEIGLDAQCDSPCGPGFVPDEFITASYGRQTADSLHFYPLESGTVTVETATDQVVEGTFRLEAAAEASVSRVDMQAFRDSLQDGGPDDPTDLPRPPQPTVTMIEEPMTIEGSFTATAGTLSTEVTRPQWGFGGGS